jgi:hypothetical protein
MSLCIIVYTPTFSLSIHLLMDTWTDSISWLLWIGAVVNIGGQVSPSCTRLDFSGSSCGKPNQVSEFNECRLWVWSPLGKPSSQVMGLEECLCLKELDMKANSGSSSFLGQRYTDTILMSVSCSVPDTRPWNETKDAFLSYQLWWAGPTRNTTTPRYKSQSEPDKLLPGAM